MPNRPCLVIQPFQDTLREPQVETLRSIRQALWLYGGVLLDPPVHPCLFRLETECSGTLRARLACVALNGPERFFLDVDPGRGIYYRSHRRTPAIPAGPVLWVGEARWRRARDTLHRFLPSAVLETLLRPFLCTPAPLSAHQCSLGAQHFRSSSPTATTRNHVLRSERKRRWTLR